MRELYDKLKPHFTAAGRSVVHVLAFIGLAAVVLVLRTIRCSSF